MRTRPLALAFLAALAPRALPQDADVPLLDHQSLSVAMSRVVAEHPTLATLLPVGSSRAGRRIEALRLAAGERHPGRPAILVVASLEGPYAWTSGLALDEARRLAAGYAQDERVRALLDSTTLYFVPRANPDAAEARFARPLAEQRASGPGVDQDRDGRDGEDGPSDVDGDGVVATMRVPHAEGRWIEDPADPRALVEADAKKGERGRWKLYPEGRDSDRDEEVAEDPELDVVLQRNFPHAWKAHDPAAGTFATDEPEALALCDFLIAHEDVALVVVYGALDNLVEKPKSVADDAPRQKLLPQEGVLESDAALLAELGTRYVEATGNKSKSDGDDKGSFQAWAYAQRGLWVLSIRPWSIPLDAKAAGDDDSKADGAKPDAAGTPGAGGSKPDAAEPPKADAPASEAGKPDAAKQGDGSADDGVKAADPKKDAAKKGGKKEREPSDDAKRLRWIDAQHESARFLPWKPFDHPELGPVEIGGFAPYARIEPPEDARAEIAREELEFLLTLGPALARVAVVDAKARELAGGLWEVRAAVENRSLLPLLSAAARRAEALRPARVSLRIPDGARVVAGERETLVSELAGSGGREELVWIVQGAAAGSIGVEVDTPGAGRVQAVPEVVR